MIPLVALLLITASITAAYKGIPDSEDKAFVLKQDEYLCLSQKTLPKNFTFINTWMGRPILYVLSEDAHLTCPNDIIFRLTRDLYQFEMLFMVYYNRTKYLTREYCNTDSDPMHESLRHESYRFSEKIKLLFQCYYLPNDSDYYNVEYKVLTNGSCNFWFCLGHLEQFKRQPPYPAFSFPVDKANYYLASDPLPKELQATDTGLVIDVLKASGQVFTVYKTSKRPIQTIEVKTSNLCSGMVVSMDFDGMCTISVEFTNHMVEYYVNGKNSLAIHRPSEIVLIFTNSTAYSYTFQPLGFYPLTDCKFDSSLVEKAEYNLKVWYDKTRSSSSCEMVKLRMTDTAAIKRWATTTSSTTAAAATTPTEAPTAEVSASTASTELWAVIAVVCFTALVVVIVAALLLIRWLKKH